MPRRPPAKSPDDAVDESLTDPGERLLGLRRRYSHGREVIGRLLSDPLAPVIALCLILVLSLAARLYELNQPCSNPCSTPGSHTLIFDEDYYVNAARVIDHINPRKASRTTTRPLEGIRTRSIRSSRR